MERSRRHARIIADRADRRSKLTLIVAIAGFYVGAVIGGKTGFFPPYLSIAGAAIAVALYVPWVIRRNRAERQLSGPH